MNEEMYHISHPVVIGDVKILERAKTFVGSDLTIEAITADELGQVDYRFGTVHVLDLDLPPADLPIGRVAPEAGHAAFKFWRRPSNWRRTIKSRPYAPLR